MHRQAINSSKFRNEQDIGKEVSYWIYDYNKKHSGKTSSISLQGERKSFRININIKI